MEKISHTSFSEFSPFGVNNKVSNFEREREKKHTVCLICKKDREREKNTDKPRKGGFRQNPQLKKKDGKDSLLRRNKKQRLRNVKRQILF